MDGMVRPDEATSWDMQCVQVTQLPSNICMDCDSHAWRPRAISVRIQTSVVICDAFSNSRAKGKDLFPEFTHQAAWPTNQLPMSFSFCEYSLDMKLTCAWVMAG